MNEKMQPLANFCEEEGSRGCFYGAASRVWDPSKRDVARVGLFHYVTRSREDFNLKLARGSGDGHGKNEAFWEHAHKCVQGLRVERAGIEGLRVRARGWKS